MLTGFEPLWTAMLTSARSVRPAGTVHRGWPRVVFRDPTTSVVIDAFEFESVTDGGEPLNAHEDVVRVLCMLGDQAVWLERMETDPGFRIALLAIRYTPIFQGMHGGKVDTIAAEMISRAQDLCRAVEARHAAEEAFR